MKIINNNKIILWLGVGIVLLSLILEWNNALNEILKTGMYAELYWHQCIFLLLFTFVPYLLIFGISLKVKYPQIFIFSSIAAFAFDAFMRTDGLFLSIDSSFEFRETFVFLFLPMLIMQYILVLWGVYGVVSLGIKFVKKVKRK